MLTVTPLRHCQVWTEDGVVYGGIPNGLLHGDAAFVIPKPTPELTIGPYKKGDDSKIFIYPVKTLLVCCPHRLSPEVDPVFDTAGQVHNPVPVQPGIGLFQHNGQVPPVRKFGHVLPQPEPAPSTNLGRGRKPIDVKSDVLLVVQVPHNLPIPFNNTWHSLHQMAAYLKEIGPCSTAYPPNYKGAIQAGCKPT